MKRKLLKDFGGKQKGQMIEVESEGRAAYLQRVGVIGGAEKKEIEDAPEKPVPVETKKAETKPTAKKETTHTPKKKD